MTVVLAHADVAVQRPPSALDGRRGAAAGAGFGRWDADALGLRRLAGEGVDLWCGGAGWLWGAVDVDEGLAGDLAQAAQRAYAQVFAALAAAGRPALLRLWNYLPAINVADGGGLERYRRFNVGRQQAFVDAGAAAFAGAPAACALGSAGPLRVRFLAGATRAVALENPRQVPAWAYSRRWGPKSPTFSRAVLADAGEGRLALFVSGTASIVGEASRHEGDVVAQTRETLANLRAVLDTAQARGSARWSTDALALTVYLRRGEDLPAVRAALQAQAPGAAAGAVFVRADICRRELDVEIEAWGFAPGALA